MVALLELEKAMGADKPALPPPSPLLLPATAEGPRACTSPSSAGAAAAAAMETEAGVALGAGPGDTIGSCVGKRR